MTTDLPEYVAQAAEQRARLLTELGEGRPSGLEWAARHTAVIDRLVTHVYESCREGGENLVSVVATGGYGRSELSPYSDIDLTLIPLDEADPRADDLVRAFSRHLDAALRALGLSVAYAYCLVSDSPGLDADSRTALLDARIVAGAPQPFEMLLSDFWATFPVGEFLIAKLDERRRQYARTHDTPLVVEPHLKEGAGGMRCFQCANWVRQAIGERAARPSPAYDDVVETRNLLHFVSGKANDRLTRPRQAEIADLTGVDPLDAGARLAESLLDNFEQYTRAVERLYDARFDLCPGVVALRGEARIEASAQAGEAAFGISLATRLGLRVSDIPAATQPVVDGPRVVSALAGGEPVVRNLDRSGLLDELLPELTRCRTLMPNDSAHAYTVFEHTLRAVREVDLLQGSTSAMSGIQGSLADAGLLVLALLLHDTGKAIPGTPHSESGSKIAEAVADRWGLGETARSTLSWLVRHHLEMARVIRMRDVHHPDTVREFAELVGTRERLDLLTLLTYADIRAVGEGAWTPTQEAFLVDLYHQTLSVLSGGDTAELDPVRFRNRARKRLERLDIPENDLAAFVESLPAYYLLATPAERIQEHYEFAARAKEGEIIVEAEHRDDLEATELTVCCRDAPGLLSRVLGVFYALDVSPLALRACTTTEAEPVALDVFTVSFGGKRLPIATAAGLIETLKEVLADRRSVEEVLVQAGKDASREQRLLQYSFHPGSPGILEFRAPRGRGMAFRLSRMISARGWNILAARVGQWAGQGAAAFYVERADHTPLTPAEVDAAFGAHAEAPGQPPSPR